MNPADNLKKNIDTIKESSSYVNRYIRPVARKIVFSKHDPEVEFLPIAQEMLKTPPSPVGRAILMLICLFFAIALAWAYFGKVDIIATATGKIVPTGNSKIIQSLEPGEVKSIHVQDGQQVKKGDVLVEIDTTISQAEQDRLQGEMIAAQLDAARLNAALKISDTPLADFVPPDGATQQQIDLQKSQLISQVQEIKSKLAGLDGQITQNEGNQAAVSAKIDELNITIPLVKKNLWHGQAGRKQRVHFGEGLD